ncbi:MAG: hypothetical protein PWR20_829 [Bacteroidales bacterium]|jgi:hypothetical protein|nr:hypothetical protein [Bacteroidales bacterium]MDN5329552.1 hypothetical protein [Bacteroidales bacterium]
MKANITVQFWIITFKRGDCSKSVLQSLAKRIMIVQWFLLVSQCFDGVEVSSAVGGKITRDDSYNKA